MKETLGQYGNYYIGVAVQSIMTNPTASVGIFYFSGTGNTEIVAHLLVERFMDKCSRVDIFKIEDILENEIEIEMERYNIIGIGYPIHALNAPRIVFEFIKRLQKADKKVFIFKCPADPFMNGGATTMVRTYLARKGYHVFYERLIVMSSNVLIRYDDRLTKQLYNAAVRKAEKTVDDVLAGKCNLQENGFFEKIATRLFSGLEWMGAPFFGKDLTVSESCNLCEVCVKNCPTANISRNNDKIIFGWNCMMCMRCIYTCPVSAIRPRLYRFFMLKEGYNILEIIADPEIKGDFVSSTTKGYWSRLYDYMQED